LRLVVDRFTQVAFSTTGKERDEVMDSMAHGKSAVDAIDDFIERERELLAA
jgi:conjugal transfer ATP-binding protein TraC